MHCDLDGTRVTQRATVKVHVDACAPRQLQRKGKVERRVRGRRAVIDPYGRSFRHLAELQAWTDARLAARAAERRCPDGSGPRPRASGWPSATSEVLELIKPSGPSPITAVFIR